MDPLYNEQISQDLSSIDGILASLFGLGSLAFTGVSAVVMVICGLAMRKPKLKWLSEYALPISLILGMASAIPLTAWLS